MDTNLLNITITPANLEYSIKNGELKNPNDPEPMQELNIGEGGFEIESELPKTNIDTYAVRSSLGYGNYNCADFNKTEAQKGERKADEGIRKIVNNGNSLARGSTIAQLVTQNKRAVPQTTTDFLPKGDPEITVEEGTVEAEYKMKDVDLSWNNLEISKLDFIPGSVDFRLTEKGSVDIEYTGSPTYVPISADPNYNPPKYIMDINV